ncbi:hypothetical protein GRQ63_11465 [Streptomyces sp. YIM 132580]|nr:hypothetical protein [Streptomyces sp. YIM 132580]
MIRARRDRPRGAANPEPQPIRGRRGAGGGSGRAPGSGPSVSPWTSRPRRGGTRTPGPWCAGPPQGRSAVPHPGPGPTRPYGYTEQNALGVVLGIGAYTLSTLANRLTGAPVDAPLASFA